MRFGKWIFFLLLTLALGGGIFHLYSQRSSLLREVGLLDEKVTKLQRENRTLTANIEYFKEPENLLKELKSKFNYRENGENLIIIVPGVDR